VDFKSPNCSLLCEEKVVLNTLNKNEYRDAESLQQHLLSPVRGRGRGVDMKGVKQTKEEAGFEGTEQISSVIHQHSAKPALSTDIP